jgi:hypothetical protein
MTPLIVLFIWWKHVSDFLKHNFETYRFLKQQIHCRVPDTEWSFQDGGLYIVKKVGVKILAIVVLYSLS